MKVLMVMTSHAKLGNTQRKTGLWLEEFAAPYYILVDAGIEVVLASPRGGEPPIDPASRESGALTEATRRFSGDLATQKLLANTVKLSSVSADDFAAAFYPGGHGPLWDLAIDEDSHDLLNNFIFQGKPIAAVCHAPVVLLNLVNSFGTSILERRHVTGFSNAEEAVVGLTEIVPVLLEDALVDKGGIYSKAEADFAPHVVVDDQLITGQNPASSAPTAERLVEMLLKPTIGVLSSGVA
jgi:putative intracellular protease/amidase